MTASECGVSTRASDLKSLPSPGKLSDDPKISHIIPV